jgi:S1-C subfamily serine protease
LATDEKPKPHFSASFIVIIIIISLMAGGLLSYAINSVIISGNISDLQNQVSALQDQMSNLQSARNASNAENQSDTYIVGDNASLAPLYAEVKDSIVVIRGLTLQYDIFSRPYYSSVQGSGFIYDYDGQMIVITNYHVVQDALNATVTFINGNAYEATVLGSDPYADLAVLSTDAPQSE